MIKPDVAVIVCHNFSKIRSGILKQETPLHSKKHRERYHGVFTLLPKIYFCELSYSDYGYVMSDKSESSIECYFLSTTIFTTTIRQTIKSCQL